MENESICIENIPQNHVLIKVPMIYLNADFEDNVSEIDDNNLRCIEYDDLIEILVGSKCIPMFNNEEIANFCSTFIDKYKDSLEEFKGFTGFSSDILNVMRDMALPDEYSDVTAMGLSFDKIKRITVDNFGLIVNIENVMIEGKELYSQCHVESEIYAIREAMNDTDYVRAQQTLQYFQNILTYKPGYIMNNSMKYVAIALTYIVIYSKSRMITNKCSNEVNFNMICYVCDCLINSRLIQIWQRTPNTRILLNDMIRNYDQANPMVQLCKEESPRKRAEFIIKKLNESPAMKGKKINESFYVNFIDTLDKYKLTIYNKQYYLLKSECAHTIVQILPEFIEIITGFDHSH